MKKSSIMVMALFSAFVLFSCDESDTMAIVKIDLSANAAIIPQQKQPDTIIDRVVRFFSTPAYAVPSGVRLIVVTATGKNMIPVVKAFDPSIKVAKIAVPEGSRRLILVKAYNGLGRAIYAGRDTVDLRAGEIKYIPIIMRSTLRQVADINSGTDGSSPSGFTLCNKKIYFSADDGEHGRELWVYDPLTDAVEMVEDIYPGDDSSDPPTPYSSNPQELTAFQGKLYFSAIDNTAGSETGVELFCYDPDTDQVTYTDIYPGFMSSYPSQLKVMNNKLYFCAAGQGDYGPELYIYDGINPVERVILIPYPASILGSNPGDFIQLENAVFVAGNDGYGVYHFFILNPDDNAVILDVPVYPYVPSSITFFNDTIYFKDASGVLCYVSGSIAAELNIIGGTNFNSVKDMAVQENFLFILHDDSSSLSELWGYNGVIPAVYNVNMRQVYDMAGDGIYDAAFLTPINYVFYFRAFYPYPSGASSLYAFIPMLGTPPIPIMQTNVGTDSIRKLGSSAVTFTDGDEAANIYVLDPSSALSSGSIPAPVKLPIAASGTVDTEDTAVIGSYLFMSAGDTDGKELWVYEHYDPLDLE